CTAGIIPLVLGGTSEPLDLGRKQRLFTPAQRRAMAVRDRTCRAVGCDIPAPWCEAHHAKEPWSRGGKTNLADGKLLCQFHHQRAHDPAYHHAELPGGDVRFHRRR
ncbi:MAG: HNH endonuclease signature motif containing protein, partial [Nocardioides sp.]